MYLRFNKCLCCKYLCFIYNIFCYVIRHIGWVLLKVLFHISWHCDHKTIRIFEMAICFFYLNLTIKMTEYFRKYFKVAKLFCILIISFIQFYLYVQAMICKGGPYKDAFTVIYFTAQSIDKNWRYKNHSFQKENSNIGRHFSSPSPACQVSKLMLGQCSNAWWVWIMLS